MQTTIYATYRAPEKADQAFVEFLERGASILDIVVLTKSAYRDAAAGTDDGRLDISEHGLLEHGCMSAKSTSADSCSAENLTATRDPFEEAEGGIRLLDNLSYPGDLKECLKKLGFAEQIAQDMEDAILEGGALLILRVPSGAVEDLQAWEVVGRYGGTIFSPVTNSAYLH